MSRVRIAVAGAGLIGRRHIEEVHAGGSTDLAAIVDPGPAGPELAEKYGVARYRSLTELFDRDRPDGVILATPNRLHVDGGLECVAAGVPVIVEKPVGDSVESATRLVEAGEQAGVPILTGHHRNYSPIMAKAREIVRSGRLERVCEQVRSLCLAWLVVICPRRSGRCLKRCCHRSSRPVGGRGIAVR
jgi:predicted dehydrogenase